MNKNELNDLIIGAYIQSIKNYGYPKEAENIAKTYEQQRVILEAEEINAKDS